MTTNLTGNTIASTYAQLLHVDNGIVETEQVIYSGTGVATPCSISATTFKAADIQFDGSAIKGTVADGDITILPQGTGSLNVSKANITGGTITGISPLGITEGGTGASTAGAALAALGVGTLGQQNSSSVTITGGNITGITNLTAVSITAATSMLTAGFTATGVSDLQGNTTVGGTLGVTGVTTIGTTTFDPASGFMAINSSGGIINLADPTVTIGDGANSALTTNSTDLVLNTAFGGGAGTALTVSHSAQKVLATGQLGVSRSVSVGGGVTQATSRTTGVTLNKTAGRVTLFSASVTANTSESFTLTNSTIDVNSIVIVNISSAATADTYWVQVDDIAAGSCRIQIHNHTGSGSPSEAVELNFLVMQGAEN